MFIAECCVAQKRHNVTEKLNNGSFSFIATKLFISSFTDQCRFSMIECCQALTV